MEGQPPNPWRDPWEPPGGGAYGSPGNDGPPGGAYGSPGNPGGSPGGAYGSPAPHWQQSAQPPGGYPSPQVMARPTVLTVAVMLMYFGAALWAFNALFGLTRSDELKEMFAEEFPELSEEEIDQAVDRNGSNVPVSLVGVGLWIWMAVANGQGKSWARITGTVFGGISVGLTLLSFAVVSAMGITMPGPETVLAVSGMLLSVVIVILMFQRDASAYYQAMSRRPVAQYGGYGHGYGYGYGQPPQGYPPPPGYRPY